MFTPIVLSFAGVVAFSERRHLGSEVLKLWTRKVPRLNGKAMPFSALNVECFAYLDFSG